MSNEARTSKSVDPKYWFNLAVENFIVQGKSERTAKTYARDLKILVKYYNKPLNQLTEDEIRKYVVYRQIDCGLQPTSMRILYCGLKFLFCEILDIDYPIFEVMKAKRERRLPDVLTRGEVIKVLNHIATFHSYVFSPWILAIPCWLLDIRFFNPPLRCGARRMSVPTTVIRSHFLYIYFL